MCMLVGGPGSSSSKLEYGLTVRVGSRAVEGAEIFLHSMSRQILGSTQPPENLESGLFRGPSVGLATIPLPSANMWTLAPTSPMGLQGYLLCTYMLIMTLVRRCLSFNGPGSIPGRITFLVFC